MAGIGFELRKLLNKDSYMGLLRAYGYAGVISSGPWILSILGVMAIGVMSIGRVFPTSLIVKFLVSITYLMALSMILAGGFQLLFTRFIADKLFERDENAIPPNYLGAVVVTTLVSGTIGTAAAGYYFDESLLYRALMAATFVTLCNIWIALNLLLSLKEYNLVLGTLFVSYAVTVALALLLRPYGLEGLLGGFCIGHAFLLFLMMTLILRAHPGESLVRFEFLQRGKVYLSLAAIGLCYNLSIWIDKFVFWSSPLTSEKVIGPLRASVIYDIPIFLAYLSIVPGMAVFLTRIETDFAEQYEAFYNAVREGDTLQNIERIKDNMVFSVRQGIYEIFKVQGLTVVAILLAGPSILALFGLSPYYIHLLYVDVTGVGVQVLLLALLNVLYYLDERMTSLFITAFFAVSNYVLSKATLLLDPALYGYGFAVSIALSSLLGLYLLSRKLDQLEYKTFMLR